VANIKDQGFAKQNYSMLDNLKLGYGGTQAEMYRLMQDAEKLGAKFNSEFYLTEKGQLVADFADITTAIHAIQKEMGIAGATALEAGTTIQGSVSSMKSAWQNLITGLADGNADIGGLIDNLVTTIVGDGTDSNLGVLGNILPAIERALGGAVKLIEGAAPKIIEILPGLVEKILPLILSSATDLVNSLKNVLPPMLRTVLDTIISNAPMAIESIVDLFLSLFDGIADMLEDEQFVQSIIDVILKIVDILTDAETIENLLSASTAIIVALAKGILQALPQLIAKIPQIILNIATAIFNFLQPVFEAGGKIVDKIKAGIENAWVAVVAWFKQLPNDIAYHLGNLIGTTIKFFAELPSKIWSTLTDTIEKFSAWFANMQKKAKEAAPNIISNIVNFFSELPSKIEKIGKNIVEGLWEGLKKSWKWLKDKVSGLFGSLVQGIKDGLGIHSPSRLFRDEIGKMMALGIGEGWDDEFSNIKDDIENSLDFNDASVGINASIRKVGAGAAGGAFGGTSIGNITIKIDGAKYSNEQSLAEAVAEAIQSMTDRRAAVYA
jgi:phage-related protein